MSVTLEHETYHIELKDAITVTDAAIDAVYEPDADKPFRPSSCTIVTVFENEHKKAAVLLQAAGGATSVSDDSILIIGNQLITRCCNYLFSLSIPDLKLNWLTKADDAACFSLLPFEDDLIVHGEVSISRIDAAGHIVWQFTGHDIFLSLDGTSTFDMYPDYIELTDFNGHRYQVDYNGQQIG